MDTTSPQPGNTLLAALLITAVIGLGAGIAWASGNETLSTEPRPSIGGWPEDIDGDEVISDSGDERIPELIRAVGDHGVEGYVRFEDLEGPQPSSPEEALQMSGQARVIAVFAADGTTVVDQYTISP